MTLLKSWGSTPISSFVTDLLPLAAEARNARRTVKRNWTDENLNRVLFAEGRYRIYKEPLDRLYKERERADVQSDDVQSMLLDKIVEHVETVALNVTALDDEVGS